jgi:hypothetical protein
MGTKSRDSIDGNSIQHSVAGDMTFAARVAGH